MDKDKTIPLILDFNYTNVSATSPISKIIISTKNVYYMIKPNKT